MQVVGAAIGDDEPLMSAGLDSLGSVEFVNVLSQKLGLQMSSTLVFDYPSVNAVTEFLTAQMLKSAAAAAAPGAAGESAVACREQEVGLHGIASVGLAPAQQRYLAILAVVARPLMAEAFVSEDVAADSIHRVPLERWDLDYSDMPQGANSTLSAQFGAFMQDVDLFDGAAYGLTGAEAAAMDPQHRWA